MRRGWLLAVCACNSTFGLERTHLPPPDAPASCPPIGSAPQFSDVYHQATVAWFTDYTISGDVGTALGLRSAGLKPTLATGPVDDALTDLALAPPSGFWIAPRLTPEGDRAYVGVGFVAGHAATYYELELAGGAVWQMGAQLTIPMLDDTLLGTPSRGPHRHVFQSSSNTAHEWVLQDSGSWLDAGDYVSTDFESDLTVLGPIQLSPDGQRAVFTAWIAGITRGVFYVDRASIDARFGAATRLAAVPEVDFPFMTADCGRVYFTGAQRVFYERAP